MGAWRNSKNLSSKLRILYGDGKGNFTETVVPGSEGIGNRESKVGDLDILGKPFMFDIPRVDVWLNNATGPGSKAGANPHSTSRP